MTRITILETVGMSRDLANKVSHCCRTGTAVHSTQSDYEEMTPINAVRKRES